MIIGINRDNFGIKFVTDIGNENLLVNDKLGVILEHRITINTNNYSCGICYGDTVKCIKCTRCSIEVCKSCILYNCEINGESACPNCHISFNLGDIQDWNKEDREILMKYKENKYIAAYEDMVPLLIRKYKLLVQFLNIMGTNINDRHLIKSLLNDDYIDDQDLRNDWLIYYRNNANTKIIDRCTCKFTIEENIIGGIIRYDCIYCNITMCKYCGTKYNRNSDHKCNEDDIRLYQTILKDTKNCPNCSIRITKGDGCDDIWCTNCKIMFKWNTMEILKNEHNPEHDDFMTRLYDVNIRPNRSLESYNINNIGCTINNTNIIERITLSNIRNFIANTINKIIGIHKEYTNNTDIFIDDTTISFIKNNIGRSEYHEILRDRFRKHITIRYKCKIIEELYLNLRRLLDRNMDIESTYINYCRIISRYNNDYRYLNIESDLYRKLYEEYHDNCCAFYERYTGVIIPIKYIFDDENIDKLELKQQRNIYKILKNSYILYTL